MKQWEAWAMRRRSPGTWTAEEVGSTGGENPMPVYEVLAGNQWRVAEHVSEADARLIAAAPDMLALLRATFDALYADPTSVSVGKLIHDIEDLLHRVDGNE
jgi:hypothetical protein